MLARLLLHALLLAGALLVPLQAAPLPLPEPAARSERVECLVYVTRTGYRYHVEDCRYLRYSRRPMTRSKAESEGYTPCRVCGGSNC